VLIRTIVVEPAGSYDRVRRNEDLAEGMHPAGGLRARADPTLTELVELIESGQLDLELQRRATMAAGQWHQQPGRKAGLVGSLDLASDEVDRTLAVDRERIVGKPSQVHGDPPGVGSTISRHRSDRGSNMWTRAEQGPM
jgi:hypothetical protein